MKNALVKSRFEKSSVQVEPGGIMTTQYFKSHQGSPLNLYREGGKKIPSLFPPAA